MGPSVVLGLLKSLPTGNFSVYIDNYFVSIPLLKHLRTLNIGCTGTVRANMTQDCHLPSKAYCKAMEKGYLEAFEDENSGVKMCMWNDNGAVTVGSNFECVYPMDSARRWSTEKKAYVVVGRPHLIRSYNQNMGGTDQMDQAIACYRPNIRNRKWYWPLFSYIIQIGCYNSWMLFRK